MARRTPFTDGYSQDPAVKTALPILGGVALLLASTGCSVAMALSGTPEPNFDAFKVGSPRQQVEIQLGAPISTESPGEGKTRDTYEYEIGNGPNGHRAIMNLYIDLATFGIWELPGTIIEARMGKTVNTTILYSEGDRVLEIQGYLPPPPSPELKKAQKEQEKYRRTAPPRNGTGEASESAPQ